LDTEHTPSKNYGCCLEKLIGHFGLKRTEHYCRNLHLQRLLVFLYGLSDAELQAEAETLRLDFRAWMIEYFDFSPSQIAYLEQMEDILASYFGTVCGFYVGGRWPITLIKEESAAGAAERSSDPPVWKIVRSEDVLNPDDARNNAEPIVTGQLTIEVVYL